MKSCKCGFEGNVPENSGAKRLLEELSFFQSVRAGHYDAKNVRATIAEFYGLKPSPRLVKQMIDFVTTGLKERSMRSPGSTRTLIEAMSNTRQHASAGRRTRRKLWTAIASFDRLTGVGSFCVVDLGVGVLRSLKLRGIRRLFEEKGLGAAELLRAVMRGKVESSTGKSFRGKGLPSMLKCCELDGIRNLKIVTGSVYLDLKSDESISLGTPLRGTMIAWELGRTFEWTRS